jgi:Mg-chelatase subunit ChlD
MSAKNKKMVRWRHILGRFSEDQLQCTMSAADLRREAALDYLYGKEYRGRGIRTESKTEKTPGTLDPSQLSVPDWLHEVRELFPQETIEVIEKHALDRYQLTELVTDAQVLETLEPSQDLLKMVLTFRNQMQGGVLTVARRLIRQVVEEIKRKLEQEIRRVLLGKLNRFQQSPLKIAQNLDWKGTLRQNLKHYDPQTQQLVVENVRFFSRVERQIPWQVILCVDESGSMADSVIHSAVMAGILTSLPALKVNLVIFDTAVVDLSDRADDPVEVLMSVQLGGGTDIGKALTYCEQLVQDPQRAVLVLVSDFAEGASPRKLLKSCRRLKESGVTLLGLAALDQRANADYDRQMAEQLAANGMEIAALTPKQLAEWLVTVIR